MNVDYMVLADAASAAEGKLYIHGAGWDTVMTAAFPATPAMSIAILLRFGWTEANEPHTLELDVIDADSRSIMPDPPGPFRGTVNIGRPAQAPPGEDLLSPLTVNLNGQKFDRAGQYSLILRIDGEQAAQAKFRVKQVQMLQSVAPQNG